MSNERIILDFGEPIEVREELEREIIYISGREELERERGGERLP